MHHASQKPDHYHAVVDTNWRAADSSVFAGGKHSILTGPTKTYEVVRKPVAEASQPMPAEIASQYKELIELATLASPAAVARLEMLADRHPGVAALNNLLASAYSRLGRMKDALAVAEKNYQQHPEYLFAKIQYAQLCLLAGRIDAVSAIFDHHFDLKLLYPHRAKYHISEFTAFIAVTAEYYLLKGNRPAAENFYRTLTHVAPDHELTVRLQSLMGEGE